METNYEEKKPILKLLLLKYARDYMSVYEISQVVELLPVHCLMCIVTAFHMYYIMSRLYAKHLSIRSLIDKHIQNE